MTIVESIAIQTLSIEIKFTVKLFAKRTINTLPIIASFVKELLQPDASAVDSTRSDLLSVTNVIVQVILKY